MHTPIRIAHLILRLDTGGAEKSLYRLLRSSPTDLSHSVVCLGPRSPIGRDIEDLGIPIVWFNYRRLGPLALWRAWRWLQTQSPDVLQGWMYIGNLLSALLARLLPRGLKVAWNIRSSPQDIAKESRTLRWAIQMGAWPWLAPDFVIYNSYAGVQTHAKFGYNRYAHGVVPNGIDLQEFKLNAPGREQVRARHNLDVQPWVGMICRFHPLKGVEVFLQAQQRLLASGVQARFFLAGPGMSADNAKLVAMIQHMGLSTEDLDLLGPIANTADFLPAVDLLVIASDREGTPNVLLEAMACGVLTVATEVGDVPRILSDPNRLVVPGQVDDMTAKIRANLNVREDDAVRIQQERAYVADHYETEQCMAAYHDYYVAVVGSA